MHALTMPAGKATRGARSAHHLFPCHSVDRQLRVKQAERMHGRAPPCQSGRAYIWCPVHDAACSILDFVINLSAPEMDDLLIN
jgi:hypothetical protein